MFNTNVFSRCSVFILLGIGVSTGKRLSRFFANFCQPRPQGFSLKKWVGREKAYSFFEGKPWGRGWLFVSKWCRHSFILFTPVIKITVRNKCSVFPCSFARDALCLGKVAIYSAVRGALSIYQVIQEVLMGCNWYISFGRSTEKSREHYFGTLKK